MIKVIGKTGEHYLNENALLQIEFRKEEGVLIAYPINPRSSKIVLEGVLKITDKVIIKVIKTEEDHKTDKGRNRPISELIDHLRASETPILITKLSEFFKAHEIVTVDDLGSVEKDSLSIVVLG